ncbi:MAG: dTDP-4-dehydrorhamnose reductase [Burkholderiaceae bacterium]|nr:dTDP-4-dehydrorhamnose reductase [Burkholderiaceae bacterium]MDO9090630.1 dTDP-4-dehydrorhamnose reductase [Burkholderiaceae bacterium]MDP1968235.1 dTDP-4-dehydrorhamnose reductase [Burkholderiaceae bacterium]
MKILLLGANGQVGWQLQRSLGVLGEVIALNRHSAPHSGNLGHPEALARTVQALRPDVLVNAAAYTAVDRAESEREQAFAINALACEVLARVAHRIGAWMVHYSTDYVFPGGGERPWSEVDDTAPLNVYGHSKLAGEQAIAAHCPRHLIFRTSWVFDTWGQNFLKSILRAAAQRDSLTVVSDQWGAPTRAALIADVTAQALMQLRGAVPAVEPRAGIYHLAAAGFTNWHAYAELAVRHAIECGMPLRTAAERVQPIPSSQYPVAAARPGNSRLDTSRLRQAFGLNLPPWQDGVRAVVAELAALTPVQ